MSYRNPNQHEGIEEEIEDLQHKINILEGDRKTTFENTQNLISQNREALSRGKMENRELRIALAQVQKDATAAGTEDAETAKLTDLCSELRCVYDNLRNDAAEKCDVLENFADQLKDIEREREKPNQGDSPVTRQIRTLENRLDKAMIKFNEAQSIRRTYEQIVKRLKEERIGFDNQLAAVERTLKAKDHDLEELTLMLHDATHSKEQAKADLGKLEDQLLEERTHRDEELKAKRRIAEQRAEMAKKLVEREKARQDIKQEAQGDLDQAGEQQLRESVVTNIIHHNINRQRLENEEGQIDLYEEAFRKIKDATGVSDINEVIMKVISQEDTHKGLNLMTTEAQAKMDKLGKEKAELEKKVEELKYAANGNAGSRTVVHGYVTQLNAANVHADRKTGDFLKVHEKFIRLMSGVEHLTDKLSEVKIDTPPIPLTEDTVVDVLAQCEQKLKTLMKVRPRPAPGLRRPAPSHPIWPAPSALLLCVRPQRSKSCRAWVCGGGAVTPSPECSASGVARGNSRGTQRRVGWAGRHSPTGPGMHDAWGALPGLRVLLLFCCAAQGQAAAAAAAAAGDEAARPQSAVREHNVRVKIEEHDLGDDLPMVRAARSPLHPDSCTAQERMPVRARAHDCVTVCGSDVTHSVWWCGAHACWGESTWSGIPRTDARTVLCCVCVDLSAKRRGTPAMLLRFTLGFVARAQENDDEGVDDEVMDRDDVKRNSSTVVDKATKRHKRQGKAKGSRSQGSRNLDYER